MRLFIALAALTVSPLAMAQDGPRCQSADTFSARRCADAVAEAIEVAAQSRDTLAILEECDGYKKKKDLQRCVTDMLEATQALGKASRVLAAAQETAAAESDNSSTSMSR